MENTKQIRHHYWQEHINAFKAKNVSKAAYCREQQLNYHQFLYWHDRFIEKTGHLVPVSLCNKENSAGLCTVDLANGHRIIIHDTALIPELKQLMQVLS